MSDTTLKVRIKRIDPSLPLPRHETPGSVGFDLLSRKRIIVPPAEIRLVPANVVVAVPPENIINLNSIAGEVKKSILLRPDVRSVLPVIPLYRNYPGMTVLLTPNPVLPGGVMIQELRVLDFLTGNHD